MKFHLVKLLLFLSLAASFMLLLNEDISPVRMPAARSRAGNDNGLCKYKASAIKAPRSSRPAREELLEEEEEEEEAGEAWPRARQRPRAGEWSRLWCCNGRWGCSTPWMGPSVWAVPQSRECPARKESAGSTRTPGRLGEAKCGYWFGICDSRHQGFGLLESLQYPRPRGISPWEAESLWDCLVSEHGLVPSGLSCKLALTKIQQHNIPGTGRLLLGLATTELARQECREISIGKSGIFSKKKMIFLKLITEKGTGKHFAGRREYRTVWTVPGCCTRLSSVHKRVTDFVNDRSGLGDRTEEPQPSMMVHMQH